MVLDQSQRVLKSYFIKFISLQMFYSDLHQLWPHLLKTKVYFVYILCSSLVLHFGQIWRGTVDACKKVNNEDKTWWRGLVGRSNKLIVSDWPNNSPNISIQQILFYGWGGAEARCVKGKYLVQSLMLGSWLDFKRIQWLGGNRGLG